MKIWHIENNPKTGFWFNLDFVQIIIYYNNNNNNFI